MENTVIKAQPRTDHGSRACRRLRMKGMVPGVVYGHGEAVDAIAVDARDLLASLRSGARMFDLKLAGHSDEKVLLKAVQYDALGDEVIHVDLVRVSLTEKVEVDVPIVVTGQAVGVTVGRGILDQPLRDLHIECLPTQIPENIKVNIAEMNVGDMILVKQLTLPEGVVTKNSPEQVVVTIHEPLAEEEVAPAVAATAEEVGEPEVIGAKEREEAAKKAEEEKE